jgi:opacity protein-like surface antigen
MKKLVSLALIATSLAVSAQAFVGGFDVGYLTDAKEEYISGRLGHVFNTDTNLNHQVEVEVGYTSQRESGVKGSFLPVTVNYRAEAKAAETLGYYFGVGAGFARTKVTIPGSGVPTITDSGSSFAVQAFAGLSYSVAPTTTLHLGVKYIRIDDVDLLGTSVDVGDDIALTAGLSFKF